MINGLALAEQSAHALLGAWAMIRTSLIIVFPSEYSQSVRSDDHKLY